MADTIRMDSHKLIFHPDRVAAWQKGELIYPIEMEVGLSGACNHRCIFCAVDYMDYRPQLMDAKLLIQNLKQMGELGMKSIIYAGEGEPLTNPYAVEIFNKTKEYGIDAAVSTNGVLFTEEKARECLKSLTWVRVSIAGATDSTYEKIHQCKRGDLQKALANLQSLVKIKKDQNLNTTLGVQLLLLPDNKDEVLSLAKIIRDIGFDYFTVKPFSQHPSSKSKITVDYSEAEEIGQELKKYENENFSIYFRSQSIENLTIDKPYNSCEGINFMSYMDAKGNIFPCIVFMGQEEFIYGNIRENSFREIWESDRACQIRSKFTNTFIHQYCRKTCRLDEINKYLHALKNPHPHVNFI